mgnify:CR=1 FL=1
MKIADLTKRVEPERFAGQQAHSTRRQQRFAAIGREQSGDHDRRPVAQLEDEMRGQRRQQNEPPASGRGEQTTPP